MARRPRRDHSPAFKAKVEVAAIKGESEGDRGPSWGRVSPRTLVELAQDFDLHPNQIKQWRDQLLEGATGVFGEAPKGDAEPRIDVKTLHAKIGETLRYFPDRIAPLGELRDCVPFGGLAGKSPKNLNFPGLRRPFATAVWRRHPHRGPHASAP